MKKKLLLLAITSTFLTACGGGGSSSSTAPQAENTQDQENIVQEKEHIFTDTGKDIFYEEPEVQALYYDHKPGDEITDEKILSKNKRMVYARVPGWDSQNDNPMRLVKLGEIDGDKSTAELIGNEKIVSNKVYETDTKERVINTIVDGVQLDLAASRVLFGGLNDINGNTISSTYIYSFDRLFKIKGFEIFLKGSTDGDVRLSKISVAKNPNERVLDLRVDLTNEGAPIDYFQKTMPSTNMDKATYTGKGVKVAIMEQSYDVNHPVLADIVSTGRWVSSDTFSTLTETTDASRADVVVNDMKHGNAVYSAIKGAHKLNKMDSVYRAAGGGIQSKFDKDAFSFGYGTAVDSDVYALEDLYFKDTPEHNISKSNRLYDFNLSLINNANAQNILNGLRVFNMSATTTGGIPISEEIITSQKTVNSSWNNGKGLSYVAAAGNGFQPLKYSKCETAKQQLTGAEQQYVSCEAVSHNEFANTPYAITVGAVDINEVHADYSNDGSGLWVTAPGGQYLASTGKEGGSYRDGTSFAAPFVTGVIAQMYEANPSLTWRDVRHILAQNAFKYDANTTSKTIQTAFGSFEVQKPWVKNAAGFSFHNLYGFGGIDVPKVTSAAKNYTQNLGTFTETTYKTANEALPVTVAQGLTPTTVTFNLSPSDGINTVENMVLKLNGSVVNPYGFYAELESPAGTRLTVMGYGELNSIFSSTNYHLVNVNGFYGENVTGTWTLRMYDVTKSSAPDVSITSAQLKALGH